jgi:hypothetical protein
LIFQHCQSSIIAASLRSADVILSMYNHPEQGGSASMKSVLPALLDCHLPPFSTAVSRWHRGRPLRNLNL